MKKIDDKKNIYYLLKWKNYGKVHNSWEPLEHLKCQELINDFENSKYKCIFKDICDFKTSKYFLLNFHLKTHNEMKKINIKK